MNRQVRKCEGKKFWYIEKHNRRKKNIDVHDFYTFKSKWKIYGMKMKIKDTQTIGEWNIFRIKKLPLLLMLYML